MTSAREKGRQHEVEFEQFLQEKKYITQRVKGSTKFNKNVDFFGLFDILAFKKDEHWLLVQVKTDFRKKVHKKIEDWMTKHQPPETIGVYAVRKKGVPKAKRWTLHFIFPKVKEESVEYPQEVINIAEKLENELVK